MDTWLLEDERYENEWQLTVEKRLKAIEDKNGQSISTGLNYAEMVNYFGQMYDDRIKAVFNTTPPLLHGTYSSWDDNGLWLPLLYQNWDAGGAVEFDDIQIPEQGLYLITVELTNLNTNYTGSAGLSMDLVPEVGSTLNGVWTASAYRPSLAGHPVMLSHTRICNKYDRLVFNKYGNAAAGYQKITIRKLNNANALSWIDLEGGINNNENDGSNSS